MEPLHSYLDYDRAVTVLNQYLDKLQLQGLSDNESKEFRELEQRVIAYRFIAAQTVGDVLPKKQNTTRELYTTEVVCDNCGSADWFTPGNSKTLVCCNCDQPITLNKC